jgi:hypothetical protein
VLGAFSTYSSSAFAARGVESVSPWYCFV